MRFIVIDRNLRLDTLYPPTNSRLVLKRLFSATPLYCCIPWRMKMLRWIKKYNKHYLMLLPFFALYSIFFLYPAISGIYISFNQWDSVHPPKWVGFDNYTNIVTSPAFAIASINLIKYVCIAIPLGITLAFCVAVLVDSYK